MEYLIPIMVVLVLVSGAVTFVVMNATRKSKPSEAASSEDSDPKTMAATDSSPLGDTTEHAGDQSQEGETVRAPEGEGEGGASGGGLRRRRGTVRRHASGVRAARRSPRGLRPQGRGQVRLVALRRRSQVRIALHLPAGVPTPSSS